MMKADKPNVQKTKTDDECKHASQSGAKKKYVKVDRPRKEQADYESIIQALY